MTGDDVDPGAAPPPVGRGRGTGCAWIVLALAVVVVVGLVVGRLLSGGDGEPGEVSVVVAEGRAGAQAWRVEAERDVEGDLCAFLYLDGEKVRGACTTAPSDVTLDGGAVTIVFGRAPRDAARVRVGMAERAGVPAVPVEVDTVPAPGLEGRYYVVEVRGDLEVTGTLEVVVP